jgi:hypothetical protein
MGRRCEAVERESAHALRSAQSECRELESLRAAAAKGAAVAEAREEALAGQLRRMEAERERACAAAEAWERRHAEAVSGAAAAAERERAASEGARLSGLAERGAALSGEREAAMARQEERVRLAEERQAAREDQLREGVAEAARAVEGVQAELAAIRRGGAHNTLLVGGTGPGSAIPVGGPVDAPSRLEGENAWLRDRLAELTGAVSRLASAGGGHAEGMGSVHTAQGTLFPPGQGRGAPLAQGGAGVGAAVAGGSTAGNAAAVRAGAGGGTAAGGAASTSFGFSSRGVAPPPVTVPYHGATGVQMAGPSVREVSAGEHNTPA